MCGLGTGSASLLQQQHFHYTFEERHWIIGNGSGSPESPSGHLPARPAHSTCLHAPDGMAEPPALLITLQPVLHPWILGTGKLCVWPSRKTKQPPLYGTGKGTLALPACFAHSWHKERHPQNTSTGDWRAIDPPSTQAAQHQPFPARFFSAL